MKCNAKIFLTAAAAVALMAGGCKTTEANYRSAYEKALEKRNESVFKRLQTAGFSRAALLIDKDEHYLVVATTDSTLETAVGELRRVESSSPVPMRSPFPYILRRP